MAFFYRFVAAAMDLENLETPTAGMMTPYSALFVFAVGSFCQQLFLQYIGHEETLCRQADSV